MCVVPEYFWCRESVGSRVSHIHRTAYIKDTRLFAGPRGFALHDPEDLQGPPPSLHTQNHYKFSVTDSGVLRGSDLDPVYFLLTVCSGSGEFLVP